jgi:hypothetical protein
MDEEGVRIVYHRDFIPERFLPLFNSCAIEMFLHKIPGLSSRFLYGNDDMFPLAPMTEKDFFDGNKPCQHYEEKPYPEEPNIFHKICRNGQNFVGKEFGKEYNTLIRGGHGITPMLKSTWEHLWKIGRKEIEESVTPFRESRNFIQWICPWWHYMSGKYVDKRPKTAYVSTKNTIGEIEKAILSAEGILCINDNECVDNVSQYASAVRKTIGMKLSGKKKDVSPDNYRMWVTYHKDEFLKDYGLVEDEHHKLFATHKTPSEKNINHMNSVYSEMVTLWYVWQNNLKTDYVGFEHYRRRMSVNQMPKKGECQIFRAINFGSQTVYQQYAQCHNSKDMDTMISVLDEKYGAGNQYSTYLKKDNIFVANCCFMMQWADFTKLCNYLFPLLDGFASACGISSSDVEGWRNKAIFDFKKVKTEYQMRAVSFLAERLISAWIVTNMKWWNGIDVAIVHYNTPEMTAAAIKSLNKCTPGCSVTVFDNSDERPFENTFSNVSVIDNTKGQIIDFDELLSHYPDKEDGDIAKSNYGSAKHSKSVDYLMDVLPNGFVLMDSDVLVKKNIRKFVDRNFAVAGTEQIKKNIPLFQPFFCWLNVPMLKENGIHYFNGDKMWALSNVYPNNRYDTGAWLFEDVSNKKLPWKHDDIWQYIIHLVHGSWRGSNANAWLKEHRNLFE